MVSHSAEESGVQLWDEAEELVDGPGTGESAAADTVSKLSSSAVLVWDTPWWRWGLVFLLGSLSLCDGARPDFE